MSALRVALDEYGEARVGRSRLERAARCTVQELSERLEGLVCVQPEFGDVVRLCATRKVGEGQVGELLVSVSPGVGLEVLLKVLSWLSGARVHLMREALGASVAQPFTLRQALAAGLIIAARGLLRGELHRGYIRRQERLLTLRGSPRFEALGARPLAQGVPCRYVELTRDTAPNRALAAGLYVARGLLMGSAFEVEARQLSDALAELTQRREVTLEELIEAEQEVRYRYPRYVSALALCRMLCFGGGPVTVVGTDGVSGWWLDMASLFERAAVEGIRAWAHRRGWTVRAQPRYRGSILDGELSLYQETRPDVEVRASGGEVLAVVDAKYKPYLEARADGSPQRQVDREDLYQLAFYAAQAPPQARVCIVAPGARLGGSLSARYRVLHLNDRRVELVALELEQLAERGELALW